MTKYAHILDGSVIEIFDKPDIFADLSLEQLLPPEIAARMVELPEGSPVRDQWTYDGGSFTPPPALTEGPPPPPIRRISALSFRRRLSVDKRKMITMAASKGMENNDATLQVFLDDLNSSSFVDLDDPEVRAGIRLLRQSELIDKETEKALLANGSADEAV